MKHVLKYLDFTALRLLPTIGLLFVLYCSVLDSLQAFNRMENYSIRLFLQETSMMSCFAFLGFAAMFRAFKRTVKISVLSRYCAVATALIYITLYAYAEIQTKLHLPEYSVSFNDYYSLVAIQKTMRNIGVLILVVSCILEDKFTRTKRILTVLCALSIFVTSFCAPLYTIIQLKNMVSLRFLWNSFLFSYCPCAVIITGLWPIIPPQKTVSEGTNEEKRPV